jgi:hypothetical protein
MNTLSIKETHHSPKILCDYEKGLIEIMGKSLPDEAHEFYEPIIQWVESYSKNPQLKTIANIHLVYFNTSSSKMILEFFKKLASINKENYTVEINWNYLKDEEDMLEAGQDYESIVKIPFNFIELAE